MTPWYFISYRKDDEPFAAALVDRALADHFGPGQVFRDSRTIPPGAHFPPEIWRAVRRSRVFLAVIGPRWLGERRKDRRPLDNPRDYVRRETALALRLGIPVIPVLAGKAKLPRADLLPADIAGLASRQYRKLRVRYVEDDLQRLIKEIEEQTG